MITRMLTKPDRKSTRLNSSHTDIYPVSLHDALPISALMSLIANPRVEGGVQQVDQKIDDQEDDDQDADETDHQRAVLRADSAREVEAYAGHVEDSFRHDRTRHEATDVDADES